MRRNATAATRHADEQSAGAYFSGLDRTPHDEKAVRHALTELTWELNNLLSAITVGRHLENQMMSLMHEIRTTWESRSRGVFERPDSSPLEDRIQELNRLRRRVWSTPPLDGEESRRWLQLGQLLVVEPPALTGDQTWQWSSSHRSDLDQVCEALGIPSGPFLQLNPPTAAFWPALREALIGWEVVEALVEQHRAQLPAVSSTNADEWHGPKSPSEWASDYSITPRTFSRRVKAGKIRTRRISSKSCYVHREDLPRLDSKRRKSERWPPPLGATGEVDMAG